MKNGGLMNFYGIFEIKHISHNKVRLEINKLKDNDENILYLSEQLKRIKVIDSKENVGVVVARNKLIEIATGEFIAFLDADDYWREQKLEKQIKYMKEQNALISCTEYIRVTEDEKEINDIIIKEIITYEDMLKNNYLGCLTVIYNANKLGKRYFKEREKKTHTQRSKTVSENP